MVLFGFFSLLLDNPEEFFGMFYPWERIAVGWWRCLKASRHHSHESGTLKKSEFLVPDLSDGAGLLQGPSRASNPRVPKDQQPSTPQTS